MLIRISNSLLANMHLQFSLAPRHADHPAPAPCTYLVDSLLPVGHPLLGNGSSLWHHEPSGHGVEQMVVVVVVVVLVEVERVASSQILSFH